jgi:hypothetical protein
MLGFMFGIAVGIVIKTLIPMPFIDTEVKAGWAALLKKMGIVSPPPPPG